MDQPQSNNELLQIWVDCCRDRDTDRLLDLMRSLPEQHIRYFQISVLEIFDFCEKVLEERVETGRMKALLQMIKEEEAKRG